MSLLVQDVKRYFSDINEVSEIKEVENGFIIYIDNLVYDNSVMNKLLDVEIKIISDYPNLYYSFSYIPKSLTNIPLGLLGCI